MENWERAQQKWEGMQILIYLQTHMHTSQEIGINLGLFKNNATLNMAYFDQLSKSQIINVANAP